MKFAGAINSATKTHKKHMKTETSTSFDIESTGMKCNNNLINMNTYNNYLTLRGFPVIFWVIGFLIVFFATFLLVNSILGPEKAFIKSFSQGKWWEYLTILIIYAIGILLFVLSKYEKIDFDKEVNYIKTYHIYGNQFIIRITLLNTQK